VWRAPARVADHRADGPSLAAPDAVRTVTVGDPVVFDLRRSLGPIQLGRFDPTTRLDDRQLWWATRTAAGPGTLHLRRDGTEVVARAWGPGAEALVGRVDGLLALRDRPSDLVAAHPAVRRAQRSFPGVRLAATGALYHAALPAVLGQRVTGREAVQQWSSLCRILGSRAPGPVDLRLPPDPGDLASRPYWWFHRLGIERKRADALVRVARHAVRLEEAVPLGLAEGYRRLEALRGIGAWTSAVVCGIVFGDPDAVPVGDYHLPNLVSWTLAGEARADDARMLELLQPYVGQRGRVLRLLALAGPWAPKFGPRQPIRSIAGC
jgi:3-methyladenine DNA glycosylase/8-oxoguanine DNA glycosylase